MIVLACIAREHSRPGTTLHVEMTVEGVRHTVGGKIVSLPFFNPPRKTATPVL